MHSSLHLRESLFYTRYQFTRPEKYIADVDPNSFNELLKFQQDLKKCCSEYQQIYKDKFENKLTLTIGVEFSNISNDEDNEFVPIEKKRLIVLNYNTDAK